MPKRRLSLDESQSNAETPSANREKRTAHSSLPPALNALMSRYMAIYESQYLPLAAAASTARSEKLQLSAQLINERPTSLRSLAEFISERAASIRALETSDTPSNERIARRVKLVQEGVQAIQAFQQQKTVDIEQLDGMMGEGSEFELEERMQQVWTCLQDEEDGLLDACLDVIVNGWPK
jgi:hypothetical protein